MIVQTLLHLVMKMHVHGGKGGYGRADVGLSIA
jgi:hypothetical protein